MAGNLHIAAPPRTPAVNLLMNIADMCEVPVERIGSSTGRIALA
jgi:hypothetical protein